MISPQLSPLPKAPTTDLTPSMPTPCLTTDTAFRHPFWVGRTASRLLILWLLGVAGWMAPQRALAQTTDRQIRGRVLEDNKGRQPIVGAFIILKSNRARATTTDFDGNFQIRLPEGPQVLIVRYTGFKEREVTVGAGAQAAPLSVLLEEEGIIGQEVVVTGFRSEKAVESTANIAKVKAEAFEANPAPSFDAALQGRAAGLQVTQSTGLAGGAVNIRVRGTGSVSAASEPLFVVDGVPIISGGSGDGGGAVGGINPGFQLNALADFDPNTIESIEVLKDAAATAQYGSRGANGVILITTKKGRAGRTRFNFTYYTGIETVTNRVPLLNGPEYIAVTDSAYLNSWRSNPINVINQRPLPSRLNYLTQPRSPSMTDSLARTTDVDYLGHLLQPGTINEASLNASGGDARTTFFLGGTFRTNQGPIRGNSYQRASGKFNVTSAVSNKLRVGLGTNIIYTQNNLVPTSNADGLSGGFGTAQFRSLPIFPVLWADVLNGANLFPFNPYYNAYDEFAGTNIFLTQNRAYQESRREVFRNISNLSLDYILPLAITYRAELGLDYYSTVDYSYLSRFLRTSEANNRRPTAVAIDQRNYFQNINLNQILSSQRDLSAQSRIDLTLAQTYQRTSGYNNAIGAEIFPNDQTRAVSAGERVTARSGNETAFSFISGMAIAKYGLSGRYFAQVSGRYEGSSRFGAENRFGFFPAVGLNWIVSDEPFLRDNPWLTLLKVRGSYGVTGNAAGIGNFQSLGLFSAGGTYNLNPGTLPLQIANPGLTWERSRQVDVSTDIGLFGNRIEAQATYFNRTTFDLLLALAVPPSVGVPAQFFSNAGSMRNHGLEFTLTTRNISTRRISWTTDANITTIQNRLLDLGGLRFDAVSGSPYIVNIVGQQLSTFFLPVYASNDPNTGDELIYRAERGPDGQITGRLTGERFHPLTIQQLDSNRVPITDKPIMPRFFGGITNTVRIGPVDISVLVSYQLGNYVLDDGERLQSYVNSDGGRSNNLRRSVLNPGNPTLYYSGAPGVYDASDSVRLDYRINDPMRLRASTRFLHSAGFVRLRQVTIGYTVPTRIVERARLASVRVYLNTTNLLTFTRFPGWDPEVSGNLASSQERNLQQGITRFDFPQTRAFVVGVQIGF